jgi:hypothetical protein
MMFWPPFLPYLIGFVKLGFCAPRDKTVRDSISQQWAAIDETDHVRRRLKDLAAFL